MLLRRQRHLDRRRGAAAGSPTTRRSASRRTAGTSSPHVDGHDVDAVDAAIDAAHARHRPAVAHLLQDDHRQGRAATSAGTDRRARRGARRQGSRARRARPSAGRYAAVRDPARASTPAGTRARRGALLESEWNARFAAYQAAHPGPRRGVRAAHRRASCPTDFARTRDALVAQQAAKAETIATRKASQQAIEAFARVLPEMIGGSADLTGSVFTNWSGSNAGHGASAPATTSTSACASSRMSAIANGLALHGGFIPYVGTFLTFSDYARNARAHGGADEAAHRSSCSRTTRSASARTARRTSRSSTRRACASFPAWTCGGRATPSRPPSRGARRSSASDGPTCLLFTRQNVRVQRRAPTTRRDAIARGGYVLADFAARQPQRAVIIATGSEVALALGAQRSARRAKASPCASCRCRAPGASTGRTPRYRAARAAARRAARRGRGRRDRRSGASTSAPSTIRAAPSSASTRFGESAPAPRAVQAFRLHRRARRRRRSRRVVARLTCAHRHPPRDARRRARPSRRCASTAGARRIAASFPTPISTACSVEASARAVGARAHGARPNAASVFVADARRRDRRLRRGQHAGGAEARPRRRADRRLPAPRIPARGHRPRLVAAVVAAQRAQRRDRHDRVGHRRQQGGAQRSTKQLGAELVVEQPFQWDGMDLVEAATGGATCAALAAACATSGHHHRRLQ